MSVGPAERRGANTPPSPPVLSIVVPFFNEEASVERVILELQEALTSTGHPCEIVAVQNGSRDRTGTILAGLALRCPMLRIVDVPVNRGFGGGVMQGLAAAAGDVVGLTPGDGQIDARTVPELLDHMKRLDLAVVTGRRIVRRDGWQRRAVSWLFNRFTRLVLGLPWDDLNGHPKLLTRAAYAAMVLQSQDNFLDLEILYKAHLLDLRVAEVNVEFHRREAGISSIGPAAWVEFVLNILRARFDRNDPWGFHRLRARGSVTAHG